MKRFLYKLYHGNTYLGLLPNVISEFGYDQDINTAGPQITVEFKHTLEEAGAEEVTESLDDETGAAITDELGDEILTSLYYEFNNTGMDLGNTLVVIRFDDANPNGVQAFRGNITEWEADYRDGIITLTVENFGFQLDQYLIGTAAGEPAIEQTSYNFGYPISYDEPGVTTEPGWIAIGQSFTPASNIIASAVTCNIVRNLGYGTQVAIMTLMRGTPDAPAETISIVARPVTNDDWSTPVSFALPTSVELEAGVVYSFKITMDAMPAIYTLNIPYKDSSVYAGGSAYRLLADGTWSTAAHDLAFQIIAGSATVGAEFLSADPSDILTTILDKYEQFGGQVTYDSTSIEYTGTEVSYTFKSNTIYEGVRKCLELAPSNWYWYVDPATGFLHFHRIGTSADHTLVKGEHFENLIIRQTLQELKNNVLFSGGDTGSGENLLLQVVNTDSISRYGQRLERRSDNRVTLENTARTLATSVLNQQSDPVFQTEVIVAAEAYDVETFSLGQMVTFANVDDFAGSLLLQIVGMNRRPDFVRLRLATNPPTVAHRIEDIRRNLDAVNTVNNPDAVS